MISEIVDILDVAPYISPTSHIISAKSGPCIITEEKQI